VKPEKWEIYLFAGKKGGGIVPTAASSERGLGGRKRKGERWHINAGKGGEIPPSALKGGRETFR